ncbi:hypothetical protein SUGI_0689100 [Cryptomeria japonica]|nr:hypothetical protein SUGI_0689100 [Cryptomeria japonica]
MPISIEHNELKLSINARLDLQRYPVELDKLIEEFGNNSLHQINIVGIVGIAGYGKTFLAKELYNRKRLLCFELSSSPVVNKAIEKCALHKLQERMLEDLGHADVLPFNNMSKCKRAITHHLKHHQLFIILDSIDDMEQLEALLPKKDNVRSSSMVIVTTRDVGILIAT